MKIMSSLKSFVERIRQINRRNALIISAMIVYGVMIAAEIVLVAVYFPIAAPVVIAVIVLMVASWVFALIFLLYLLSEGGVK